MSENLNQARLTAIAEDIEYFRSWWEHSPVVADNATLRHGSAALRRLLVDDVAGRAWRQLGFEKGPSLQGPDLLAFLKKQGVASSLVAGAVAGGIRFAGIDWAFLIVHRADNPSTGVLATAEEGFAVVSGVVSRDVRNPSPSELDALIDRTWRLHQYLDAPGIIRIGQAVNRREVIKHVANEMGGVHLGKNTSSDIRELLEGAERTLFIETKDGSSLRTYFIEILAVGQAIGRSTDFQTLAATIRRLASAAAC